MKNENKQPDGSTVSLEELELSLRDIEFCSSYSKEEADELLKLSLNTCLTADAPAFSKAADREKISYFFRQLSNLLDLAYRINGFDLNT